jgi:asparagine synthase (glutamine-hydrolysing)
MPGFLGTIGPALPKGFAPETRFRLLQEQKAGDNWYVERRTIRKFLDDKIFSETDDFLIVTEGVILNKKELEIKYGYPGNFKECIITMYKKKGETFFNEFRGSFSGLFYDKKKDNWFIYTDHIGDKQVFYAQLNKGILFGSEPGFLAETLKINNIPLTINKTGVYLALTHGFVIEDHTLINEIKKLSAGNYLKLDKERLREVQYHRFTNKPVNMSIDEAIEGVDKYFRQAVKRQFDKDLEYGYTKHTTTLSGGLDSRMTVWIAHNMGYTRQVNFTFSQSGYLDFSIAQQVATDLKHEFLFKALDHGTFLMENIDKITKYTYGNACFFGLSHGKSIEDLLNNDSFGIRHTGMIGDAIIGTFFKRNEYNQHYKIGNGAYSLEVIERLQDYKFKYDYENEEIFCLYTRAFTGANQGQVGVQEHTESCSPFCDVDFLEFCYSIPLNLRFNHKIYFDWILTKYPGAAEYMWEKKQAKIKSIHNKIPQYMILFGQKVPALTDEHFTTWLKGALLRRMGFRKKGEKAKTNTATTKDNMNPVDYWYMTNPDLKIQMDAYFDNHIHLISDNNLRSDMEHLYNDCVVLDKLQTLSVLAAIKLIIK